MLFDTITRRPTVVIDNFEHRATIWAYRSYKKFIIKKLTLGAFSISAAGTLVVMASYFAITLPFAPVSAAKNVQTQTQITQTESNIGANTVVVPPPVTIEAAPIIKNIPRIIKRGGFENVYIEAGKKYGVPWQLLAAVHFVETGQSGDTNATSTAGALGPMQFMQNTFDVYAEDGDSDGTKSIYDVHDAIYSAAKNLAANKNKMGDYRKAIFNYNHSEEYVEKVINRAREYGYSI